MSSVIDFKSIAKGLAEFLRPNYQGKVKYEQVNNDKDSDGVPNPHWRIYLRERKGFFRSRQVKLVCLEEDLAFDSRVHLTLRYHVFERVALTPSRDYLAKLSEEHQGGKPQEICHYSTSPRGNCG